MPNFLFHMLNVKNTCQIFISYAKRQKCMPNFLFHMVSLLKAQQTPKIHSEVTSPFPFCHQDILNCIPCAKLYFACKTSFRMVWCIARLELDTSCQLHESWRPVYISDFCRGNSMQFLWQQNRIRFQTSSKPLRYRGDKSHLVYTCDF